jgi:hypothetical protein
LFRAADFLSPMSAAGGELAAIFSADEGRCWCFQLQLAHATRGVKQQGSRRRRTAKLVVRSGGADDSTEAQF